MEHFRTHTYRFFQGFRANWLNHEFLNINVVVCVLTAVDDVHHRNWHRVFAWSAVQFSDVFEQWLTFRSSCCFGVRQGNSQDCVRTEVRFVFSTVQIDHDFIDASLVFGVFAKDCLCNWTVNRANSFGYAFAQETGFVAIAQFQRFAGTSRGT